MDHCLDNKSTSARIFLSIPKPPWRRLFGHARFFSIICSPRPVDAVIYAAEIKSKMLTGGQFSADIPGSPGLEQMSLASTSTATQQYVNDC